jgi:hypothetical protein
MRMRADACGALPSVARPQTRQVASHFEKQR